MLHRLEEISEELLQCPAWELHKILPGPTLISLDGLNKQPLFLSVLLHGNEDTGWEVIRSLMRDYQGRPLPRAMCIFIGNVKAAAQQRRKLDTQPDFNRVWDGSNDSPEAELIQTVLREMQQRQLFASIDIHNNTGLNPHYACINSLQAEFLNLARRFSRTIVYFVRPRSVQSLAFSRFCPALTLECGQSGDRLGIEKARHFVEQVLQLAEHPGEFPADASYDLFHTTAVIKIPDELSISFDGSDADIQFIAGIEKHNFEEIDAGTPLATINTALSQPFRVLEESGKDVFAEFFILKDSQLFTRKPVTPSMLTDNITIVRQDCLCYLMERYQLQWGEKEIIEAGDSWTS